MINLLDKIRSSLNFAKNCRNLTNSFKIQQNNVKQKMLCTHFLMKGKNFLTLNAPYLKLETSETSIDLISKKFQLC